ncbi:cell envelope integrity protein TolA [Pseudoxanthomonas suwonensis]|uniref:Membrane protein TolA n=1 Tax=Pseudoxanthomonas suwonensis TaxID=314722 RepID=A0A0E3UNM6_9GAMM|nr:cell envelope integrity protein TolA [Pseudoxanthomonas suwonensis]AKC87316.1 membrane protein TolA [Pseudoxanthomonas suwonensis]
MHADAFYRNPDDREGGLAGPFALAVALHILVALLFWVAWWWSPQRQVEPAAGSPVIEASLVMSPADVRAAQERAEDAPKPLPEPPQPVVEPAPEETVPPPQPLPEPRPQDAPVAPQQKAQDFIPQPDTVDQEAARRDAIARERAEREQEERRRQEQVDLTEERERQRAAENQRRLAAQAEEAERQKRLADIRRQREQAARQAELAEQRLRQLQQAQQRQATPAATPSQGTPGQGGTSEDLTAQYAAAIQQAVLNQWIRPDTVPLGQRCRVQIRQIPGGEVIDVDVQPGCPFDEAGRRSLEAAVLRAKPLPYRGFESVFQRNLTLTFEAQDR